MCYIDLNYGGLVKHLKRFLAGLLVGPLLGVLIVIVAALFVVLLPFIWLAILVSGIYDFGEDIIG